MTYKDQFVVEVKADGQILRVRDGAVYLPFGCEYSILLKNLNSKRASINISIDGSDVLDNRSLILNPLKTHELQGFFKGNVVKNRFRFIQKTKEIQEHRGDKVCDGLVRVEFAFEKPVDRYVMKTIVETVEKIPPYYNPWHNRRKWDVNEYTYYSSTGDIRSINMSNLTGDININANVYEQSFASCNAPIPDEGITVKGNEIHEQYNYTNIGSLEQSSVIVIELKGMQQSSGVVVKEPVTVKRKLICSSCGIKSVSSYKFCPNCGTFLE